MTTSLRSLELRALATGDGQENKRAAELRAVAVQQGSVSLVPGAGALTLTGYAPGIAQPQTVTPAVGSVALTGYAPGITQPQDLTPGVGSVALTGYAPALLQPQAVTPAVGSVTLTGYAPALLQPQAVTPAAGTVVMTGYAPVLTTGTSITPVTGSIVLTGYAPTATQSARYFAHPSPEVWLQTVLADIQVSQAHDERLWTRDPESVFCSLQTLDYQARYSADDLVATPKRPEGQHVEIVQNSYPTTGADDVYITASTVI